MQQQIAAGVRAPLGKVRLCAALLALGTATAAQAEVILHAFNWPYATVQARAAEIKSLGYASVLVSPPLKSEGTAWWARYQPQDYRTIDSPLGNRENFVAMSNALRAQGVKVYADIVLNHMANEAWKRSDLNYPGQQILNLYAGNPTGTSSGCSARCRRTYCRSGTSVRRAASAITAMSGRCRTGGSAAAMATSACPIWWPTAGWCSSNRPI